MLHTEKCSIAKIIKEENIICNQFKHLENDHSTYLNTLIQDLGGQFCLCCNTDYEILIKWKGNCVI